MSELSFPAATRPPISALRRSRFAPYCPPPMGLSLGKRIAIFVSSTVLVCSGEKHGVGEYREVQRERGADPAGEAPAKSTATSASPVAKPTPAEFFPTKPR